MGTCELEGVGGLATCYETWGLCSEHCSRYLDLCPEHLCYDNLDSYSGQYCVCFAFGVVMSLV